MRWIATPVVLAGMLAALGAQAQQAAQTAEGAQKFLSALARKGNAYTWFVDAAGRTNYVRGKSVETVTHIGVIMGNEERKYEKVIEKQLSSFLVQELDTQGPDGKSDACMTRIAKWQLRETLVDSRSWQTTDEGILIDTPILHAETSTYELPPELAAPRWIDWRNVKIARTTNGAQMTASFKEKTFTAHLAFTGETELVDRVEYAMKFLKLSCDDTTSTGF